MGYAGGRTADPTYHSLGDHTETLQIDYDPRVISCRELLDVFWKAHDPEAPVWSRQYMAAVFFNDEKQKRLAEKSRDQVARSRRKKITTRILPAGRFYLAEDYHQKYRLRQVQALAREFSAMYPGPSGFVNSTAAARVNGFVGGYGDPEFLKAEIDRYGLSAAGKKTLLEIVAYRIRSSLLL